MTAPPGGGQVRVERVLPAPPERVFDAWLDADGLTAWLCPDPAATTHAELDARVGGHYHIVMQDGETTHHLRGEYLEIDRPRRLAFTWVASARPDERTIVTVDLAPHAEGTHLTLTHTGFGDASVADGYRNGWRTIAGKLAAHLAG